MKFQITDQCISCCSTKKKLVYKYSGFESIEFICCKCLDCDLLYASPQPVLNSESLNEIYDSNYYKNYFGKDINYTAERSIQYQIFAKILSREFDYYSSFLDHLDGNKKVLDIGCGDGRFLEHFVKLGWNCFGIEPSKFVADLARKRKINVLDKHILELDSSNKFDFIFMDNVLEHCDYPAKYLKKVYSLLDTSGVFVLKTPNSNGIIERTETWILSTLPKKFVNWLMRFLLQKLNMGSGVVHRYGNLHPPVHLSVFNKKSITKVLTIGGFNKNEITVICASEHYHQWRVKQPRTLGLFNKALNLMKKAGDFLGRGEMLVAIVKKER